LGEDTKRNIRKRHPNGTPPAMSRERILEARRLAKSSEVVFVDESAEEVATT
jgi:hypothetical protein